MVLDNNTFWSMEEKEIWCLTSLIRHHHKAPFKIDEKFYTPLFSEEFINATLVLDLFRLCSTIKHIWKLNERLHPPIFPRNFKNSTELLLLLRLCITVKLIWNIDKGPHSLFSEELISIDVEGGPKVTFSIAKTPRCREGRYYFPWIALLSLDTYLIMLSV